jgi:DNA topoisomerase-2
MENFSTPKKVNFVITPCEEGIEINDETLKLHTYLHTSNMVLFTSQDKLKKYNQVDEIIDDFCKIRYDFYERRKKYIIKNLEVEIKYLNNKERFIREVMNKSLNIMNVPENDIIDEMEKREYDKKGDENELNSFNYNYLLQLQIRTFTLEKVQKLKNEIQTKLSELNTIKETSEEKMWLNELHELEIEYQKFLYIMTNDTIKKK